MDHQSFPNSFTRLLERCLILVVGLFICFGQLLREASQRTGMLGSPPPPNFLPIPCLLGHLAGPVAVRSALYLLCTIFRSTQKPAIIEACSHQGPPGETTNTISCMLTLQKNPAVNSSFYTVCTSCMGAQFFLLPWSPAAT